MGTSGAQEPFKIHTGYHIFYRSVTIVTPKLRVKYIIARRENYCPDLYLQILCLLMQIYSLILTDACTDRAFLAFKKKAAVVYIRNEGYRLREINVDSLIPAQVLVKRIRDFDRTVFNTGRTAGTFLFLNVPGFFNQVYGEISSFPSNVDNFRIGQDLYVGVPVTLNKLR